MKVLMLGWEFPPRISGGLGTACQGIVEGLVAQGVEVLLVVPRLFGGEEAAGARVVAAGDVPLPPAGVGARAARELPARLQLAFVDSPLQPYQTRTGYAAFVQRAQRVSAAAHPAAGGAAFVGGYGPTLAAEVERYAHAVAELAAREEFDVIHAHDWMTVPAGFLARRVSGCPLVYHVHATETDRAGDARDAGIVAVEQAGLDGADRIVCVSHFTRDLLEREYRLDAARARVVHNAVRRDDAPAARPDAGGPPTVLFLGRLTRQKGPDFFLNAAARIAERRPDVRFVVSGDGDLRDELVERAARLGIASRVEFTGFLGPAAVERAYAQADVYVMPSASEPFGIAPLEALMLDTPVIVSRASGVAERLPSCPKVDYGDVDDLARGVLALLADPALRAELVRAGQADIARLRWERTGEQLVDVYTELVGALV